MIFAGRVVQNPGHSSQPALRRPSSIWVWSSGRIPLLPLLRAVFCPVYFHNEFDGLGHTLYRIKTVLSNLEIAFMITNSTGYGKSYRCEMPALSLPAVSLLSPSDGNFASLLSEC